MDLTHLTALHDLYAVLYRMHLELRNYGSFADEMDVSEMLTLAARVLNRHKMRPVGPIVKPEPVEA